jgi:hypothetical protein
VTEPLLPLGSRTALRLLVGREAPLSAGTITRLTQPFKDEDQALERHDLSAQRSNGALVELADEVADGGEAAAL